MTRINLKIVENVVGGYGNLIKLSKKAQKLKI